MTLTTAPTTPGNKKARLDDGLVDTKSMDQDVEMAPAGNFDSKGKVHDLMPLYYSRLFPTTDMFRWLAYGNDKKHPQADGGFFQRREFCFTLEGDIFVRYQSFKDGAELHAALKDKVPEKIDIGPLYNVDPARRAAYSSLGGDRVFSPVERELVMDIDMTDYDDVRTCCSGAGICNSCWPLMTVAIKVLDRGLRADFGFNNILWVYSGRRGVHAWVCDARARQLSDEARSAVAEYFSVYKGGVKKVALTTPLHPALSQAHEEVLKPFWLETLLPAQRYLEDPTHIKAICEMIPEADVAAEWVAKFSSQGRRGSEGALSVERWRQLEQMFAAKAKAWTQKKDWKKANKYRMLAAEIVFIYTYPRLDVEVSKHMNHLLKAPFCVHPKTGRVCVPIDPVEAEAFDPLAVPTVAELLNELDTHARENPGTGDGRRGEEHAKTSFGPYVEAFRASFLQGCLDSASEALQEKAKVAGAVAKAGMEW